MATISWSHNVSYDPNTKKVLFVHTDTDGNEAESMIDYYRELYPAKSWQELLALVVPEFALVGDKNQITFYSL